MFVFQTVNHLIATDMGIAVYRSLDFLDWFHGTKTEYRLQESSDPIGQDDVPVGDLDWTYQVTGHRCAATNLPEAFRDRPYCRHQIFVVDRTALTGLLAIDKFFVKPNDYAKHFMPLITDSIKEVPKADEYFVSDIMDIQAEWRVFVLDQQILDVRRYAGGWDKELTEEEAATLRKQVAARELPFRACTVDIARTNRGLEWIEIHNFVACGLYGFEEPIVAKMAQLAWREELNTLKNQKADC